MAVGADLGLLAHWALDETTGSTAADSSGRHYDGQLMNGPVWSSGVFNGGLQFDGVNDYVDAGRGPAILGKGGFTVAAWVQTSAAAEQVLVQQRSPQGYDGEYVLQTQPNGTVRFWMFGNGMNGANVTTTKTINDGQWRFVVAVREDDGTGKIYIDGELAGSHSAPARTMTSINVYLGADMRDNRRFLQGALDDVRIYNRALTADEIRSMICLNQEPSQANDDTFAAVEDSQLVVANAGVLANDTGESLAVTGFDSTSQQGAAVQVAEDGRFTYDPRTAPALQALAAGQTLTDVFTYSLEASAEGVCGGESQATVTMTVTGANDAPVAIADDGITRADSTLNLKVLANDIDVDANDVLTITAIDAGGLRGAVQLNGDNTITYDPAGQFDELAQGQSATETFRYTVRDSQGVTASATVTVTIVAALLGSGSAVDDSYAANEDTVLHVAADGVLTNDIGMGATQPGEPADIGGFYVSPTGSPFGDGSWESPWSLEKALSNPSAVQPGSTIWLRGGLYQGHFVSQLNGTAEAPITVRAYPGERVQIDLYNPSNTDRSFTIHGNYTIYQGFEVFSSEIDPRRTNQSGTFQTDINRGGVSVRGHHNKLVNMVVHDLNTGIGYWGDGGEIYGSIVYNNGWLGPDRAHGHGLYLQNMNDLKVVSDNIVFNQFAAGIHAYGSSAAHLNGIYLQGNVTFDNGAAFGQGYLPERDILVGGEMVGSNITLHENFAYQQALNGVVDVGYLWGPQNENIRVTDNYFANEFRFLKPWDDVVFTGNTIVRPSGRVVEMVSSSQSELSGHQWDHNRYVTASSVPFLLNNQGESWSSWRSKTGFDAHSTIASGPEPTRVFVRPNAYEEGRGHVIVYNWEMKPEVSVDLSDVLEVGDHFEIRSALDPFGEPVIAGIYGGNSVNVPMTAIASPSPIGYTERPPTVSDRRFGAFLVTSAPERRLVVTGHDAVSALGAAVNVNPDGSFTYDPRGSAVLQQLAAGEATEDQFTYTVNDGARGTVRIQVTGRNDGPSVEVSIVHSSEEGPATSQLLAGDDVDSDDDAASLRYELTSLPVKGVLQRVGDREIEFDPAGQFDHLSVGQSEDVTFRYRVVDQHGAAAEATGTVTVVGVNDSPVVAGETYDVDSATVLEVSAAGLLANDLDADAADVLSVQSAGSLTTSRGASVVVNADGSFTYDPRSSAGLQSLAEGETVEDQFTYTVSDGSESQVATATVRVAGRNHPPVVPPFEVEATPTNVSGAGKYVLAVDAAQNELVLTRNSVIVLRQSLTDPRGIHLSGAAGVSDSLTIRMTDGNPLPIKGITWDGLNGPGVDELFIEGGHVETLDVRHTQNGNGSLTLGTGGSTRTIEFRGVEPLNISTVASQFSVQLPDGDDQATLQSVNGNSSTVSGSTFATTKFTNPASSLFVNGGGGEDSVEIRGGMFSLQNVDLSLVAETTTISVPTELCGGDFTATGRTFVNNAALRTSGGNVSLEHAGEVRIGNEINTAGGNFTSQGSGAFNVSNYLGAIRTAGASSGGQVLVDHAGNVTLFSVTTNGGPVDVQSGGNVWLRGRLDLRSATGGAALSTSGINFTLAQYADVYTGGGSITLLHSGAVSLSDRVWSSGGDISIRGDSLNIGNYSLLHSGGGDIVLDHAGDVTIRDSMLTMGGDFISRGGGKFQILNYSAQINTYSPDTGGRVVIDHAGDIGMYAVTTGGGAVELKTSANVAIHGRIDTRGSIGGSFQSSGVDFVQDNYAEMYTGGGAFTLLHRGNIVLGEQVDTGGGVFRAEGAMLNSMDSGAAIRTGGGSATFDVIGTVDLKGALVTSGGNLFLTLHVGSPFSGPKFKTVARVDFTAGSMVTINLDGTTGPLLPGLPLRLNRLIQAQRFSTLDFDTRVVDAAIGDDLFLAELLPNGTNALDLLVIKLPEN